jgi:3D (Asp-Asp-Asp) domain-containing protein
LGLEGKDCVIRRSPLRAGIAISFTALLLSLAVGSLIAAPSAALADSAPHTVTFVENGAPVTVTTHAPTVAALLAQRGLVVHPDDYVYPAAPVPLSNGLVVDYRAARPITIVDEGRAMTVVSSAQNVGELLDDAEISLQVDDVVTPSLGAPVPAGSAVRIVRVVQWQQRTRRLVAHATLYRLDLTHPGGRAHVVRKGRDGARVTVVTFTQFNGGPIVERTHTYLARKPQESIIDDALGPNGAYGALDRSALARFGFVARSKVRMVATAYTPHCYGCSGRTAIGLPAGPGIVAVDPRVIPLGTRLYIPGYGFALAGDTGGDIVGDRVDLGFASYRAAVDFGRREVTVYTLK